MEEEDLGKGRTYSMQRRKNGNAVKEMAKGRKQQEEIKIRILTAQCRGGPGYVCM